MKKLEKMKSVNRPLNAVIVSYVIIVLAVFACFTCTPLVSLVRNTPLYHVQTILGLTGGVLILADLLVTRTIFRAKGLIYLSLIVIAWCISSLTMSSYGVKSNLFLIAWSTLFFTLFYTLSYRFDALAISESLVRAVLRVFILFWSILCLFSFLSFFFNVAHLSIVVPDSNIFSTRQGFYSNRLFGVFPSINQASIISSILLIYCLHRYKSTDNHTVRRCSLICALIFFCFVILSGSRSAFCALELVLFVVVGLKIFWAQNSKRQMFIRVILAIASALIAISIAYAANPLIKSGLAYLPQTECAQSHHTDYQKFIKNFLPDTKVITSNSNNTSMSVTMTNSIDILERRDTEEISNHRMAIWKDYLSVLPSYGLFGMSPNNYSRVFQETHPNLFIVSYIKEHNPSMFLEGKIYHPHNAYLMMLVSAGFVGFTSMLYFLFCRARHSITHILTSKNMRSSSFCAFLIIMVLIFSSFFDQGLWLDANLMNSIFWITLGYLSKKSEVSSEV